MNPDFKPNFLEKNWISNPFFKRGFGSEFRSKFQLKLSNSIQISWIIIKRRNFGDQSTQNSNFIIPNIAKARKIKSKLEKNFYFLD